MDGFRRKAGIRKKRDLTKLLEVLTFLIKSVGTSACYSVSYLATLIMFRSVCQSFVFLSVRLSTPRGGDGRLSGGTQYVEASEWV